MSNEEFGIKEIRANRFVLEDENGKTRAMLWVNKDTPGLSLYDKNGEQRAWLSVGNDNAGLGLYDGKGKHLSCCGSTRMGRNWYYRTRTARSEPAYQ